MSDFDAAIHRQHERLQLALAAGVPRLGWKICVNDKKGWRRMGLAGPFVGVMNGARVLRSGQSCPVPPGVTLAVEPEIAIYVGDDVGAHASLETARAAIVSFAPALELVDYAAAPLTFDGVIESSSFHYGAVFGAIQDHDVLPLVGRDGPLLLHNGEPAGVPDPELVPADLAEIVVLVATFLARYGQRLAAGDCILSGACTAPVRVEAGDRIEADFGALGVVSATFTAARP